MVYEPDEPLDPLVPGFTETMPEIVPCMYRPSRVISADICSVSPSSVPVMVLVAFTSPVSGSITA